MPTIRKHWEKEASKLVGRKIVKARYLTEEEAEGQGWDNSAVVLQLDDGSCIYPSSDDEGNDAGALFIYGPDDDSSILPVMPMSIANKKMG